MIHVQMTIPPSSISRHMVARLSNAEPLWRKIADWLSAAVQRAWGKGGEYGREPWPAISPRLYGQDRLGTDGEVHGTYGPQSIPLDASGRYRQSFDSKYKTPQTLIWGSRHPLAARMPFIGRGNRFALPDSESPQFTAELDENVTGFVDWAVKQAILDAQGGAG